MAHVAKAECKSKTIVATSKFLGNPYSAGCARGRGMGPCHTRESASGAVMWRHSSLDVRRPPALRLVERRRSESEASPPCYYACMHAVRRDARPITVASPTAEEVSSNNSKVLLLTFTVKVNAKHPWHGS